MRQPTDNRKVKELYAYYLRIRAKFEEGTLKPKMGALMQDKLDKMGLSASSWQRAKKKLSGL